jgi:hypothetical protein
MKTNKIPCILKDQQEQLKIVERTITHTRPDRYTEVSHRVCFCGCLSIIRCRYRGHRNQHNTNVAVESIVVEKHLKDDLYGSSQYELVSTWFVLSKDKHNNNNTPTYHLNRASIINGQLIPLEGEQEEVILLTDPSSPICSILTSEGTFHNVYNLDHKQTTRKSSAASTKTKNSWITKAVNKIKLLFC